MDNYNYDRQTEILAEAKNESKALKMKAVQDYFDNLDTPEKQETELKKFGDWLNDSPEVQEKDAKIMYEQCMNAKQDYDYNFKEWSPNLVDLLDQFIKTQ